MEDKTENIELIRQAGQRVSDDSDTLANAVVKQNARMDRMEGHTDDESAPGAIPVDVPVDTNDEEDKLAHDGTKQDVRMDKIEARAKISRGTYSEIVEAGMKVQSNSEKLRNDVDQLLARVEALEDYVAD